jgi:hypothetical protein
VVPLLPFATTKIQTKIIRKISVPVFTLELAENVDWCKFKILAMFATSEINAVKNLTQKFQDLVLLKDFAILYAQCQVVLQ